MKLHSNIDYRADIDGLRAVAVLSVIGFHAFPAIIPGGFIGVDIFFVISGFLISSIIFKGLDRGTFTFKDFYLRRVKRIFPSLICVLGVCLFFAWYVLLTDEYQQLGKHVAAGAWFVSNLTLWRESGYFDTVSELKPLLHLWSLGVEEQFYIVWPPISFLLYRFRSRAVFLILCILITSFIANIYFIDDAFFLPHTRFWELGIGGFLAYITLLRDNPLFARDSNKTLRIFLRRINSSKYISVWNNFASLTGFVLFGFAIFAFNGQIFFPGWRALIPSAGAFLLIAAGENAYINRVFLKHRVIVFIGLISYPLYLWHWPLMSFSKIIGWSSQQLTLYLVALSFILAWLTYRFIEIPIRSGKIYSEPKRLVTVLLAGMVFIAFLGLNAWKLIIPPRLYSISRDIKIAHEDWFYPGNDIIRGSGTSAALFIGDSYMQQYYPRLKELSKFPPWSDKTIIFETSEGCAPFLELERVGRSCNQKVLKQFRLADQNEVQTIIIAASWLGFLNRGDYYNLNDPGQKILDLSDPSNDWIYTKLENKIKYWVNKKKRVYIILGHPGGFEAEPANRVLNRLAFIPSIVHRGLSRSEHNEKTKFIHYRVHQLAEAAGATVLDPADWLCRGESCQTESENGTPIYMDKSHLRASFVRDNVVFLDGFYQ